MPESDMTPQERREGSPLMRMLNEKLLSCHNEEGRINIALVARKLRRTRQSLHHLLNRETLSPAMAWEIVTLFENEVTIRDLKPFVLRAS